jgi:trans-2,3-dihydro-3-hydroxyanthranilate isomerase
MSIPPKAVPYSLLDVFAESPLEGNMLAVFTDARELSAETMQALARETNLAETTFILPREAAVEAREGVKVRIFTVQEELRFAGHPTLGTATWIYRNHPVLRGAEVITLDLPVGPISVRFSAPQENHPGVFATMQQNPPVFGEVHSPPDVAAALGLSPDDLDPTLPVQTVSTGMAFCIVPLRSLEVAARLAVPQAAAQAYLDRSDAKFFYCITRAAPNPHSDAPADWHARMQFYNGEDPATGSAAGCAISYLVQHGIVPSGQPTIIEQGIEIRRPSRIHVSASFSADQASPIKGVFVGGRTIPVASGQFFLP